MAFFQHCSIAIHYSGFKATPVSILIGSVPVRQSVHVEQGTRSHRNRQAVHIDPRERVGRLFSFISKNVSSEQELSYPLYGEEQKEKALISQDFFGLVVATGLEPVTPSM